MLLVATQSDEPGIKARQERWWLRGVAEAAEKLGARLLIKLHPMEAEGDTYTELLADFPATARLFSHRELSLAEGLAVAEALVIRDSTVAFEAALLGKPTLTVTLAPDLPRFPLAEHGGALGVARYEDLEGALRAVLSDSPERARLNATRPSFLAYHLGALDGKATERIVAALRAAVSGP